MKHFYTLVPFSKNLITKKIPVFIILLFLTSVSSFGQGGNCGAAETISISVGNTVCDASPGNTSDNTQNTPNISGCASPTFYKEGWYSFTVTGGPLDITITVSTDGRNLYLQLMSSTGPCAGRTQIACANNVNSNGAQTETISMTLGNGIYYVKVVDVRTNGNANMNITNFCITAALPPCNTPTVTATTAILPTAATINWNAPAPAPANGYQYVVSTSNTAPAGAGTADTGSPANITGLTPTTTYYVFIRSDCGGSNFSSWDGPVSFMTATPTNNEPCTAEPLTPGATCIVTNNTTVGSTPTIVAPNNLAGCGSHDGTENDVWFTTIVSATGALQIDAFDIGIMDPVIAVYTGATCGGNLTLIDCDDDSGPGSALDSQLILTGLTPGITIYIRVWDFFGGDDGPFDICVTNITDPCASITNITCGATPINATIASGDGIFNDSCFDTPGAEQIFSFTPGVTGNYSITQITTFGHINYALNTTCGATGWDCIDDLTGDGQTSSFFNLINGTTYYIMLDSEDSAAGNVSFTLNCSPPPPLNDLCSGAITLNCGDADIAGTTNNTTDVTHNTGCTMSNYGVWYTFAGNGDQVTIFTDAAAGFDHEISIVSGSCGSFTNIACRDASGAGGNESYTFITTNGTTYYIYIAEDSSPGDSLETGDFEISLSCTPVIPPPNDNPCGGINLIVNSQCVTTSATNVFASDSTITDPTCGVSSGSYQGGDVWFTVTVPPSQANELTIETQSGVVTNGGMAVYTGSCSGTLTEIACSNNGNGNMPSITVVGTDGFNTGDVLYIRVWENGNNVFGSFSICVTAPIPAPSLFNVTICQGDTSEPMITNLECFDGGVVGGNITGTIDSGSLQIFSQPWLITSGDPCAFDAARFRRYDVNTFTVTDDGTYVFVIDASATTIFDTMGYIYETVNMSPGSCTGGGYIAGDDDSGPPPFGSRITAFLQAGVDYTLVTTNALGGEADSGTYTWDVGVVPTSAEWFENSTGGSPIAYGSFFDPVPSFLADTETPGTYSFWAACPNSSATRIETTYTINPRPAAVISGASVGGACGSYEITITAVSASPTNFFFGYSIDGGTQINIFNVASPYTFTATAPAGSVYTLTQVANLSTGCQALLTDLTGSATVTSSGKIWVGGISSAWTNGGNWAPSGEPTLSDCVIIPSTGANDDPIIDGSNDNAEAGSITVQNGGNLLVLAGGTITVQNEVTVNAGGIFELEGANGAGDGSSSSISANLVQINDAAINSGVITQERAAWVRRRDYVYWSSPVENYNTSTISGTQYIYDWIPTIYVDAATQYGNWNSATSTLMAPGKGYIVQGPNVGNTNTTAAWNLITFNGTPHNGLIQPLLQRGTYTGGPNAGNGGPGGDQYTNQDDNWNLIGNPYPSNLDADAFLAENAQNNARIDGVVYLWSHGTEIRRGNSPFFGEYAFSYDEADYIAYNYMGTPSTGYNGIIGSGQGFFVFMEDDDGPPSNNTVGTQVGSTNTWEIPITFNNSMRVGNDEQFFRSAQSSRSSNLERHRIWLSLVQPSDNVSTLLIGYAEGATMEKDKMFDAAFMSGSSRKLYSIIENDDSKYVIQGRALPFEDSDRVPLGIIIDQEGEYAINLENVDGLFDADNAQNIYVEDLDLGIIHNLKESPYFFTPTEMGEFANRFAIRFTTNSLGIDEFNLNTGIVIMAPNSDYIKITSSYDTIESVLVYDLLGRKLIDLNNVNSQELVLNKVSASDGILMVKVTLTNGLQKIQKVVLRH